MAEEIDWEARCAGALAGAAVLRAELAALRANDCPSCQQLQRELAAAVQRAEQAEADLKIAEQHLAAGRVIQDGLRSDLAAARRDKTGRRNKKGK